MGLLDEIVARTRIAVAARRAAASRSALEARAARLPGPRNLASALTPHARGRVRLLAELKRASPVAGVLARGFDPIPLAPRYVSAGAAGLSILTDPHFQGSLADLEAVRAAVDCPVLQKDFVVDEYQVWEARATGADALLLIVAILEPALLADLFQAAKGLGLGVLVEVHDEAELEAAADLGAGLIGINNRDLQTLTTSLEPSLTLLPQIPPGPLAVSESGLASGADVARVVAAGAHAVLVGETLLRAGDVAAKVRELSLR